MLNLVSLSYQCFPRAHNYFKTHTVMYNLWKLGTVCIYHAAHLFLKMYTCIILYNASRSTTFFVLVGKHSTQFLISYGVITIYLPTKGPYRWVIELFLCFVLINNIKVNILVLIWPYFYKYKLLEYNLMWNFCFKDYV